MNFVIRNPWYSVREWRDIPKVRKAMREHKIENPVCAWCSTDKKLQTHHIVPVSVNPFLAGDPDNMITLCSKDHLRVGHNGNFRLKYESNIAEMCRLRIVIQIV